MITFTVNNLFEKYNIIYKGYIGNEQDREIYEVILDKPISSLSYFAIGGHSLLPVRVGWNYNDRRVFLKLDSKEVELLNKTTYLNPDPISRLCRQFINPEDLESLWKELGSLENPDLQTIDWYITSINNIS